MATIPFDVNIIQRCSTTEYMKLKVLADPQLQSRLDVYEQQMQAVINPPNNGGTINIEVINP